MRLEFTVIGVSFLNAIVGEVDLGLEVIDIELIGRGAYVAVLVPICSEHTEEVSDQHEMSEVKFTVVVE